MPPDGPRNSVAARSIFLVLALSAAAIAQDVGRPAGVSPEGVRSRTLLRDLAESWRWRYFDRRDGLSSSTVTCLYQDRDDFIYASTDVGLSRYDFHRWVIIENDEPFDDGPVVRIVESRGRVFCATETAIWSTEGGGPLRRIFPVRRRARRAPGGRVFIASGALGEVFLIHEEKGGGKRHFQIRGAQAEPVEPVVRFHGGRVLDYQIDQSGVHWLATNEGIQYRQLQERRWVSLEDLDLDLPFADAVCRRFLAFDKPVETDGDIAGESRVRMWRRVLWGIFHPRGRTESWVLARLDGRNWRQLGRRIEDVTRVPVEAVVNDRQGNHYATCEDGSLYVLPAASSGWLPVNDPHESSAKLLRGGILDASGDLWFEQRSGGVASFDGESRRWDPFPGIPDRRFPTVLSLLEASDDSVWVGTTDGVLRYRAVKPSAADIAFGDDGGVRWELEKHWVEINERPLGSITGLAQDARGKVWISSSEDFDGAYVFDGSSWVAQRPKGFGDFPVRRIVTDAFREQWFLPEQKGREGVPVVYRRSSLTGYAIETTEVTGFSGRGSFNDLVRVSEDVVWLASDDGLLRCRLTDERIQVERRYGTRDGLTGKRIWAVSAGADGSIWVCYWSSGRGVTRIDGESLVSYDVADGLPSSGVFSIVADRHQTWFGTEAGVARFDGECWYGFPIASESPRTSGVFTIVPSRASSARRSLLVGTLVHGVQRLTPDDSDRPQFVDVLFPDDVRAGRDVRFAWDARDYKDRTSPGQLLFRHRLDGGDWSAFTHTREAVVGDLGEGVHSFEVEVRDVDGNRNRDKLLHRFVVDAKASPWPLYLGAAILGGIFLVAFTEISRRRLRERAEQLRRYRGLFLSHPACVFLIDGEFRVLDFNGVGRALLGLEEIADRDLGGKPLTMIGALSGARFREFLRACRFDTSGEGAARQTTVVVETASGEDRVLQVTCFADGLFTDEPKRSGRLVVLVEDSTHEAAARTLVKRDDRLRGIRDLASRVSESIEGLLASLEALRGEPRTEPGAEAHVTDAASERAPARIEERLREARKTLRVLNGLASLDATRAASSSVDLEDLLETVLLAATSGDSSDEMVRRYGGVRVDYRFQVGLWPVAARETELEEVMREILANAFEAMPGEGELVVRANNLQVENDPGVLAAGAYVEVSVRDGGHGIDPSQLDSIFDPFYSTKPRDRAMGVGLSLAYSIVRAWGGDIRVWSRPSLGTTVRVLLPAKRGA
jgi:signal transduction histidine kinase/ligand-binding sensor domain-containing protein